MQVAKCKVCGARHQRRDPHEFGQLDLEEAVREAEERVKAGVAPPDQEPKQLRTGLDDGSLLPKRRYNKRPPAGPPDRLDGPLSCPDDTDDEQALLILRPAFNSYMKIYNRVMRARKRAASVEDGG